MESTKTRAFPKIYQCNFAHSMAQPKDVKDLLSLCSTSFWVTRNFIFRAIFDLSTKNALLILRIMYALYVKKKKTKTEIVSKE